jgi:hypothetical protein
MMISEGSDTSYFDGKAEWVEERSGAIIRLSENGEIAFLGRGTQVITTLASVVSCPVNCDEGNGRDANNNNRKENDDEPGSAVGLLGRGLSDPHGVDKGVRDETNELHGFLIGW